MLTLLSGNMMCDCVCDMRCLDVTLHDKHSNLKSFLLYRSILSMEDIMRMFGSEVKQSYSVARARIDKRLGTVY